VDKVKNEPKRQCGRYLFLTAALLTILNLSLPALGQVDIIGDWQTGTSHTKEPGTDRALIFIAHAEHSSTVTLNSVTYGGQTMTKIIDQSVGASYSAYVTVFILEEAGIDAATSSTFNPSWSATPENTGYASVFLSYVNQTDLIGDSDKNGFESSTQNITTNQLSTGDGDIVFVGATCGNTGDYTVNNGFTEAAEHDMASSIGTDGYKSATGSNETPSVTFTGTVNRQVIIGFVVQSAPPNPNKATNPDPCNASGNVPVSTNLSWDAPTGFTPTSYDVYFGTDTNAHSNPKNTVYTNSYDPPGDLAEGTTYYWVVDSNDNGTIYTGDPWSFTTLEHKATNPNPSNGQTNVSTTTSLSWTDAIGATSYDVYFGTNSTAHSNPKNTVYTNSCNPPGDLNEGTTYYWAVDSNDDGTIYTGDDWSFTTYVPVEFGDLVVDYILSQALTTYYASACSYYGAMIYSEATGDTAIIDAVIAAFPSAYYTGAQMPPEGSVDENVYGIVPFELYRQTGDANYLTSALYLADKEFESPRPDGLSEYTRFWIDDTYMIGSLQTQAYKSTADPNYINRAVTQLLGYMGEVENLQQSNGLFYHTLSAPIHWGRGNGWAAAAMTEVLLSIPQDHPQRAQLLTKYQNMMAALVTYQGQSGMWYQVLDMGSDPDNWLESSCTGMFVFALASGVKEGWLPEQPYKQAALDGWVALDDYVDEQGRVHEICTGTGASSDVQYYFDRPREIGNPHGQAAVIWAATAIKRLNTIDIEGDIDGDGDVDFYDLDILTDNWLGSEPSADIAPAVGDGVIDFLDFAKLAENWMN
jgi:rhamnogalacturonyl hydrolase YesR